MELILDTHVLLWLAQEPDRVSVRDATEINSEHTLFISHVSVWEIAIKLKAGKIELKWDLQTFIKLSIDKHLLNLLPIALDHIYKTQSLPFHHRDPFDRLLIAQSLVQNIPIVSSDSVFEAYGVSRIW